MRENRQRLCHNSGRRRRPAVRCGVPRMTAEQARILSETWDGLRLLKGLKTGRGKNPSLPRIVAECALARVGAVDVYSSRAGWRIEREPGLLVGV
jgi:hypothetical protein